MKIINKINSFKKEREIIGDKKIGFVPTMGYLHDGHLSLVDQSVAENEVTVVSIFVNPTQFGPSEDLDRYPRDLDRDKNLLEERMVDFLFFPDSQEMYGENFSTYVNVEKMSSVLCGKSRPTHFKGVATVCLKLFNIVQPSTAYFGQKDAQQAIIIKRMVNDLDLNLKIKVLPIIRDKDGMALSSRNNYLSQKDRQAALSISRALHKARNLIQEGLDETSRIKEEIKNELLKNQLIKIDYVEITRLDNLNSIEKIDKNNTLVAAAIKVGTTRLIDNFILGEI